jgi:thioesterase domain-containing protein/acyl carrier protein
MSGSNYQLSDEDHSVGLGHGLNGQLPAVKQLHLRLKGSTEPSNLRKFWGDAVERSIGKDASLTSGALWQEYDLRVLPPTEAQSWLESFLKTDLLQRLPANHSLQMRCSLVRINDEINDLIWTFAASAVGTPQVDQVLQEFSQQFDPCVCLTRIEHAGPAKTDGANGSQSSATLRALETLAPAQPNGKDPRLAEIEQRLIKIWEAVLNVSPVGVEDDFFDLGGHSLLAAKLMARVEDSMRIELPLASLLEAPTIRAQARHAYQELNGHRSPPEPASNTVDSSEVPLFFLGGDATFQPLVRRLGDLRDVHSLGLRESFFPDKQRFYPLNEIAALFVREIRRRQPAGPYALGGWCAHGLLAYETAQQLRVQGHQVSQLILLETVNPVRLKEYSGWKRRIARVQLKFHHLKFEGAYIHQLNRKSARDYLSRKIAGKVQRWTYIAKKLVGLTEANHDPRYDNLLEILYAAAAAYVPEAYDSQVTLVRSLQRTFGFGHDLRLGWDDALIPNLQIRETSGNHYTIYTGPNVESLAHTIDSSFCRTVGI